MVMKMSRRTKVCIRRTLFLLLLSVAIIGVVYAFFRLILLRQIAGLLSAAMLMTLVWEWMDRPPDAIEDNSLKSAAKRNGAHLENSPKVSANKKIQPYYSREKVESQI